MTLPGAVQSRISALETRLSKCERKLSRLLKSEKYEQHERVRDEEFIGIFKDTCALVREAELADAPYLIELAKAVTKILDGGVEYAYGGDGDLTDSEDELYDFMPSWAHGDGGDRPLVKDENGGKFSMSHAAREALMRAFRSRLEGADLDVFKTEPWDPSLKRHPKSTSLSRFRPNLPTLTLTLDKPLAASVLDARCEISSSQSANPVRFYLSSEGTCLTLTGTSGYGNRSSSLEYFILNQPLAPSATFPTGHRLQPKLSNIGHDAAIDESRRLIFVGDAHRIKSFEWGSPSEVYKDPSLVHVLDTKRAKGPMTVLPTGSVVRASKGGASVWDTQVLSGNEESVEEPVDESDVSDDDGDWEDEDSEDLDRPAGSAPTSQIKFLDQPNLKPSLWQPLLATPSAMICAEDPQDEGSYRRIGIDLEVGKSTSYYLGHGAEVSAFSASRAEPQLFLTACNDGFARLFDVRRPLPVITFDACGQDETCEAVAFAHPDGIPIVFTGARKAEQIKVWDARARACVYELATGNNAVQSLAWDAQNYCLYAATECDHDSYDYRCVKIPKNPGATEESIYEDEDMYEISWPRNAWHKEDYFGRLFDAGEHRIIRYAFKEDPKLSVVP